MSVETIIKCDRCGKTFQNDEMRTVNIVVKLRANNTYMSPGEASRRHADWCCDCCKEMQIDPIPPKLPDSPPAVTIDDLIREIVRDEVGNV